MSIENYALIQQLELELSPSLNIITGETGAGKSILLGALGLIMGNRADTAVLKDSGRNCVIEGLFDMGGYGLETFFDENELDYERHTVIRRIVTPAGKSRAYVNDLPVQLATLRELAAHLIDIHSQNQGVLVADGEFRIRVLDSLADNRGLRAEYGRAYRALREREQELARLREEVGRNRRDEEYMRFQWQQIAALGLHEGELQELEAEQRELSNAEGILAALSEAGGLMENDETGVLAALKTAEAALQRIGGVLEGTSDLAARIHSAYVELKDVSGEVASLAGRIEDNPARLEAVDNRIGAVSDLMRRYGAASSDELLALGNDLATRLEAITDSDAEIAELEAETGALRVTAEGLAAAVTASRTEASALFDEAVGRVLARLGMPSARFVTEITPSGALSPSGADSVRFLFNANGGEGSMEPQRFEVGVDTALNTNAFTRESYKFIGWNTAADGSGATYADAGAILELTGDMTLYAQWQFWNGWLTDVNGKQYYKDGELQKTGWTVIDGNTYYLDTETGYAATGIATLVPDGATEEARCVFDAEGVFQSDVTGVYSVGAYTYWLNGGIIEEEAGLKRVVKENGKVNYYYFAVQKNLEERDGLTLSAAVKSTVLNGQDCWLHKTNGLALPEWGYYFDENGVILHDEDTGKNGILKDGEDLFYYVDGIKAPAGMIKIGDDYYYANSKGQLIVNQTYYCSRMNDLMKEGTYAFDAEGKLIQGATDKNGIVKDDDGVLRYYVNGKVTYVGLIEIDGDFYYVRSSGEVVTNCVYWITWTHGLKEAGYYTFDESGKLTGTPKNGIVEEDGVLHYYVNGTLTYAGLIKIGDDYYYVNSKCEVVRDCDYYISWTHDLMPQGRYHFDADGKLTGSVAPLKNGIYEEDGSLYFYRNGERAYAGLIQIDGDYYYVRSTCEVVHDRSYYVYWTHGLIPEGYYNFDSAGRMILDSETE